MESKIIKPLTNIYNYYTHIIKYGIIGLIGLIVDFSLFYVFYEILGFHYQIANIIAIYTALTHNFILNSFFNFKVRDKLLIRYIRYLSVGLIGLTVSSIGLYVLIDHFGANELFSKLIVLMIVVLLQYKVNYIFTFKK